MHSWFVILYILKRFQCLNLCRVGQHVCINPNLNYVWSAPHPFSGGKEEDVVCTEAYKGTEGGSMPSGLCAQLSD